MYFLFFSLIRVGHFDLKTKQIVENIMSTIEQLVTALPGGAVNLRNIYIKTQNSMALPLYVSMGMFLDMYMKTQDSKYQLINISPLNKLKCVTLSFHCCCPMLNIFVFSWYYVLLSK